MNNTVANITEIEQLVARGAIFFVGHSGGKDSQAMYAAIRKVVPHDQIRIVHADLGEIEWSGVKQHIVDTAVHETLIAQAIFKDGTEKNFFSMVRARRAKLDSDGKVDAPAFPDIKSRFCTSDLKTGPIWKVIRNAGTYPIVVNCVGIRGDESRSRQDKIDDRGTLNTNKKNTNGRRDAFDWWPIAHWTIDQVWAEIANAGQVPHPAYEKNERLSCCFCIFGSRNDLRHAAAQRPELLQKYTELEAEVRTTMFNGESLADRIGNLAGIPIITE